MMEIKSALAISAVKNLFDRAQDIAEGNVDLAREL